MNNPKTSAAADTTLTTTMITATTVMDTVCPSGHPASHAKSDFVMQNAARPTARDELDPSPHLRNPYLNADAEGRRLPGLYERPSPGPRATARHAESGPQPRPAA
jgi:hypothetical protein